MSKVELEQKRQLTEAAAPKIVIDGEPIIIAGFLIALAIVIHGMIS